MALIWKHEDEGRSYEVRRAGNTVRLYRGGAFHSQFNPRHPTTAGVWDLLMFAAFFRDPGLTRRVLLLGVGGGAVVRLLQRYVAPASVVGIDIDRWHLHVAKKYFGARGPEVELIVADARRWVSDYDGERFDLIIDDLFGEADGDAHRAVEADAAWIGRLSTLVSGDGALALNFGSAAEFQQCRYLWSQAVRRRFAAGYVLTRYDEHNRVAVLLGHHATQSDLRRRLRATRGLDPRVQRNHVAFRTFKLFARGT